MEVEPCPSGVVNPDGSDGERMDITEQENTLEQNITVEETPPVDSENCGPTPVDERTREVVFMCRVCKLGFCQQSQMTAHLRTCSAENQDSKKSSKDKLNSVVNAQDRLLECELCDEKFPSERKLQSHRMIHNADKPYPCDCCTNWFFTLESLKEHQKVHTGKKKFRCRVCAKLYTRKVSYLKHVKSHIERGKKPKLRACGKCGEILTSKERLDIHRCAQMNTLKPFICNICLKEFAEKSELEEHSLYHERRKHIVCFICRLKFARLSKFKVHLKAVHSEWKPFTCDTCAKSFSSGNYLQEHFKTHKRRHACGKCDQRFVSKRELDLHGRVHDTVIYPSEQNVVCDDPGNSLRDLKNHVLRFGKKPFYCELCSKRYIDRDYLRMHKRVHSSNQVDCPVCGFEYSSRRGFLDHVHSRDDEQRDSLRVEMSFEAHVSSEGSDMSSDELVQNHPPENPISSENSSAAAVNPIADDVEREEFPREQSTVEKSADRHSESVRMNSKQSAIAGVGHLSSNVIEKELPENTRSEVTIDLQSVQVKIEKLTD